MELLLRASPWQLRLRDRSGLRQCRLWGGRSLPLSARLDHASYFGSADKRPQRARVEGTSHRPPTYPQRDPEGKHQTGPG